jgi:hypothetical protein
VLGPAETILLRYMVAFGGTCEPGEVGRHMHDGGCAMPVEVSAKVPTDHNIEEDIFDAQIATMCFAPWLSSLPRDQVRRGRPFPPEDGRIFSEDQAASSCRLPRCATATHGISRNVLNAEPNNQGVATVTTRSSPECALPSASRSGSHIDEVPPEIVLSAGMTTTVAIGDRTRTQGKQSASTGGAGSNAR